MTILGTDYRLKDVATFVVSFLALVISTLNFLWPRIKEWNEQRKAIFKALQGEKEAIADIATQVSDKNFDLRIKDNPEFRSRLLKALSMAFVLESSDRAKAYVVDAFDYLIRCDRAYKDELLFHLERIEKIYSKYRQVVDDREFERRRIEPLKRVIQHIKNFSYDLH